MKTLRPQPGVIEAHLGNIPGLVRLSATDLSVLAERALLRLYAPDDRLLEQADRLGQTPIDESPADEPVELLTSRPRA